MLTRRTVAPSYARLRPLKPRSSATFPVYHQLVEKLATATDFPDVTVAHILGTCAGYAYSDQKTVAMIMARMGLEDNHCLMLAEAVDAMFICSTAFLVQSKCGRVVILCYRGTEPMNFINWLTDIDVNPEKIRFQLGDLPAEITVHGGFYRNVRATRYAVISALLRALDGKSVVDENAATERPLEALYITGHSLGAAMAALMGVMLTVEPEYQPIADKLKAVYTYGQPMIGNQAFARACTVNPFLGQRVFRYVFGHDIVPQLPPTASGEFEHFGLEYRLKVASHGKPTLQGTATKQLTHVSELLGAPLTILAKQVQVLRNLPMQHSLYDHEPQHYIAALTPEHVRSEFGD